MEAWATAVAFDNQAPKIDPHPELVAPLRRDITVARGHAALDRNGATHRHVAGEGARPLGPAWTFEIGVALAPSVHLLAVGTGDPVEPYGAMFQVFGSAVRRCGSPGKSLGMRLSRWTKLRRLEVAA